MKVGPNNKIPYTVDKTGAIEINSLKGTPLFDLAQECNIDNNELLDGTELTEFLNKYQPNNEDKYRYYYEEKDKNGNIIKRCVVSQDDAIRRTYYFEKGEPVYCTMVGEDNTFHIKNLQTGVCFMFDSVNDSTNKQKYVLNDENCKREIRFAKGMPTEGFSNPIDEFIYRFSNWNWE